MFYSTNVSQYLLAHYEFMSQIGKLHSYRYVLHIVHCESTAVQVTTVLLSCVHTGQFTHIAI